MLHRSGRWPLATALSAIACMLLTAPGPVHGQAQDDESPPRVVTVTAFEVPYNDRAAVWSYMRDYWLPGMQLHPKVLNLRVLTHLYGSGGAEVIITRELAEWAAINEPCGTPCEEYRKQHPAPEEGAPGYAEYAAARELFQKYYSNHRDEIYSVIPSATKIEGRIVGTVGPPTAEVAAGGGGS